MASFQLAWEQNADACELDVYLSKDHKVVVIHDKTTKRLAGIDKLVADQTSDELRQLDVGRWKNERFAGEKIPLLSEVLASVPQGKKIFVEVKCGPEIVPELNRVLQAAGLASAQTPVISFQSPVIAAIKKSRPDLPAYWIVDPPRKSKPSIVEDLIATAKASHADGLDISADPVVDEAFAKSVRAAGLKCFSWTVNDPVVARRMAAIGMDGITTDRPGWLREQLKNE